MTNTNPPGNQLPEKNNDAQEPLPALPSPPHTGTATNLPPYFSKPDYENSLHALLKKPGAHD